MRPIVRWLGLMLCCGACSGGGTTTPSSGTGTTPTPTTYTLNVGRTGGGTGSVASSSGGISCGSTCSASYTAGTVVSLTATAASGSVFSGWGGACSGTGACTVTMNSAQTVTAGFDLASASTATLSVATNGNGSGTVSSAPAGISCGSTCQASFAVGSVVSLTASAANGSMFSGWGGACSGAAGCSVTMTGAQSVTATFTQSGGASAYMLSVSRAGAGTGTVTSSPSGISCGSTCSAYYATGTLVTLLATPDNGSVFAGWSGACTGTGSCTVSMTSAQSVSATFQPGASSSVYTLTVEKGGTGLGTVVSAPGGISCGSSCAATYAAGATVLLSATPATNSVFSGWAGSCSGTGTCSVPMNSAQFVAANFSQTGLPPTYALVVVTVGTGSGTVTINPGSATCVSSCVVSFVGGTSVTLTASAANGSTFAGWVGACSGTGACNLAITANTTLSATFNKN
ncbi:MAG: InlB B-repeat-containing protein [Gemmatimonadaceae bacterium]